jgi:type IV fimbrial biogenesis protein FimT
MTFMSEACNTLNMDKEPGFTLVELLVTIVVVSILLAIGAPAFKDFIKNNRVTSQSNGHVSIIQLARSEALKRGTNMVVCPSNDQVTPKCTGKDTWADGWILFSDLNLNNAPDVGTGQCLETEDCIMATREGLPEGTTLTTDADFVCFLPTGLSGTNTLSSPTSCTPETGLVTSIVFTLKGKNCEKNQARKVTITPQGHTLVSTVACS